MLLIDAIFINNGGGKILLEYLILELEKSGTKATFLLDKRYFGLLPKETNKIYKFKFGFLGRHFFYLKNKDTFSKVFCFGNIPPSVKLNSIVYTYFHQFLFLTKPHFSNTKSWFLLHIKKIILNKLRHNSNFWIVQNNFIADEISNYLCIKPSKILVIPFYRSFNNELLSIHRKKQFLYVSSGESYKNHINLIKAFMLFYDKNKIGELHLTISNQYKNVLESISSEYPIINHDNLNETELMNLYYESEYFIYPSRFESFGLGIVEAIECGCKVVGSDLPYLHQVCYPSGVFNPESVNSIFEAIENIYFGDSNVSRLKVSNNIDILLNILKIEK